MKNTNKKGQMTVYAILMLAVLIIIFASLHPILSNFVGILLANSTDTSVQLIVNLYIPMIALMILITIVSIGAIFRGNR